VCTVPSSPTSSVVGHQVRHDEYWRIGTGKIKCQTVLFSVVLLASLMIAEDVALACSCLELSPEQAFKRADTVFRGTVIKIRQEEERKRVTLKVENRWKGILKDKVQIETNAHDSLCGYPFRTNGEYLIYANRSERVKGLRTGICHGNREWGQVNSEIRDSLDRLKHEQNG